MSTTTKATHTPTPYQCSNRNWRNEVDPHHWYITGDRYLIEDKENDDERYCSTSVARVEGNPTSARTTEETARFIVRACNSHDELLEACRYALRDADGSRELSYYAQDKLRAAIAKATGD